MVDSIDKNLITQFSDMLHVQAQQIKARLRPFVQIKQMSGDVFAYDGLGDVEAREIVGRVQRVVHDDITHNRRKISRRRFAVTLPIDASDVRGALIDPQGPYAEACITAMERRFDRTVIEAMFAAVSTGRDFDTSVTFANDGGSTVNATAGLTYEKLLEIKKNFTDNEVGNDVPVKIVLGLTGEEEEALMKEAELTSGDYSRQYAVDQGELVKVCGMQLIKYGGDVASPLLAVSSGTRDCFAMTEKAMCVGMNKDMSIKIYDDTQYYETTAVQIIGEWGAVRTEGKLIQKVQTTDA